MGRELNEYQWHIEWRDPSALIPYEHNAKQHDGKNISNIAASIKKYGWQSYLVVTKAGVIVIGHGRRLAAIELGCKCPCKVIEDDLTDAEIRELRNVDNLTHDNKYEWDVLKEDLEDMELDFSDFDFDIQDHAATDGEPENSGGGGGLIRQVRSRPSPTRSSMRSRLSARTRMTSGMSMSA